MLKNNFLLEKIGKKRRRITARVIETTIKITIKTMIITKKITTTRTTITLINKTLAHINQDYLIFLNAQNVANIVIKNNDNNKHRSLINENEKIYHAKMIFAKTSIAFTLTQINK